MVAVSIKYVANVDAHDVELPARSAILHVDARRVIRMTWESGYLFLRFPPRRRFGGFPPSDGASGYPPSAALIHRMRSLLEQVQRLLLLRQRAYEEPRPAVRSPMRVTQCARRPSITRWVFSRTHVN